MGGVGFPGGAVVRDLSAIAGGARDAVSISGLGRFSGVGNGTPLQYSCLENSMGRGACYTVHGAPRGWTQLSNKNEIQLKPRMLLNAYFKWLLVGGFESEDYSFSFS